MEHDGYHFEVADASLELLMRRAGGWEQNWFEVESFRVITDDDDPFTAPGGVTTEATIKVHVGGERVIATAEGNGPVNALDTALRAALGRPVPGARLGAPHRLQGARARHRQGHRRHHPGAGRLAPTATARWTTIGVSENIIEASWQALYDSLVYGLLVGDGGQ